MFYFCLLALVASTSASVYTNSECPETKPVSNFNLTAYGQGIWYEVARYPNFAEIGGNCGYGEYKLDGDLIRVKNVHIENNKRVWIEGIAGLHKDANGLGKLVYVFPYGDNGAETEHMLEVLDTDYDNYAIGYYCKYNEKDNSRQDFAWILSRSKVLPFHVKKIVNRYVRESKVLDTSKFMWPDFSDGACRVEN